MGHRWEVVVWTSVRRCYPHSEMNCVMFLGYESRKLTFTGIVDLIRATELCKRPREQSAEKVLPWICLWRGFFLCVQIKSICLTMAVKIGRFGLEFFPCTFRSSWSGVEWMGVEWIELKVKLGSGMIKLREKYCALWRMVEWMVEWFRMERF